MDGASQLDDETAIYITTNSPISLPLPALSYDYEDLNFILFQDESVTSSMTISNSGEEGSVLSYSVSKTGLLRIVSERKKLLTYLKRKDLSTYEKLVKDLKIRN